MTPGKSGDDKDNPLHFSGEICLNQGAPERQSLQLRCTLGRDPASTNGETERLQGVRRDPLWVKIREVGRGLSLADTQTGR